jgi:PHP family Zn ribbon phosphoesterase
MTWFALYKCVKCSRIFDYFRANVGRSRCRHVGRVITKEGFTRLLEMKDY